MSIEALRWAWQQHPKDDIERPDPIAKLILICLADQANNDGRAEVKQETLASFADCGQRTVVRKIKFLESKGLLETERQMNGARRIANLYVLSLSANVTPSNLESANQARASQAEQELKELKTLEPLTPESSSKNQKNSRERRRKEVWDALVRHVGDVTTKPERSCRGGVVKDLLAIGATPEQIEARCDQFRREWPNMTLTDTALHRHWSKFSDPEPDALPPGIRRIVG